MSRPRLRMPRANRGERVDADVATDRDVWPLSSWSSRPRLQTRPAAWSASFPRSPTGHQKGAVTMNGRSVSTVTAYTAHQEWATRPPDERYASVHALAE